jgi:hypothetical protein
MIIGIGNDILQLSRLHAWPLRRLQRLLTRILTTNERKLLASNTGIEPSLFLEKRQRHSHHDAESQGQMETIVRFVSVRYISHLLCVSGTNFWCLDGLQRRPYTRLSTHTIFSAGKTSNSCPSENARSPEVSRTLPLTHPVSPPNSELRLQPLFA